MYQMNWICVTAPSDRDTCPQFLGDRRKEAHPMLVLGPTTHEYPYLLLSKTLCGSCTMEPLLTAEKADLEK